MQQIILVQKCIPMYQKHFMKLDYCTVSQNKKFLDEKQSYTVSEPVFILNASLEKKHLGIRI